MSRLTELRHSGALTLVHDVDELDACREGETPGVVLSLEGAEAIERSLDSLDVWYADGLRVLGVTWSRRNAFGHGVPFAWPSTPDIGPGLTDDGRRLVQRCRDLGIAVDVSHLNSAGFWDVARLELGPIIASHSAAHRLCPNSRNVTDAQLDEIARSEGLVGVVFATRFLRPDHAREPDTSVELIAEHARYIADRIGPQHVALGSDFDGALLPAGLDAGRMQDILASLGDSGFSADEIADVAWHNWRRALAAWW
jgi:membrane dipeptidase